MRSWRCRRTWRPTRCRRQTLARRWWHCVRSRSARASYSGGERGGAVVTDCPWCASCLFRDSTGTDGVPLKIGQVLHKVKVEVDEEGTVAAAATAVVMGFGGCVALTGPPPFQVCCNRPFAFAVAHVPSSLVLFAGSVERPGCVGDPPPAAVSQFGDSATPALASMPHCRSAWASGESEPASLRPPAVVTSTEFFAPCRLAARGVSSTGAE